MADVTYYVDLEHGQDTPEQTGEETLPYKTLAYAIYQKGETAKFKTRGGKKEADVPEGTDLATWLAAWEEATKSALKKAVNGAKTLKKKAEKEGEQLALRAKEQEARDKVFEDAKKIVLEEDKSLPAPIKIKLDDTDSSKITLGDGKDVKGTRVRVFGRVHRERKQSKVLFITLRDGYGYMQVVLTGKLAETYDALTLTRETSMEIFGELRQVPEGAHAPNNRELHADFYKIPQIWKAPGGDDAM